MPIIKLWPVLMAFRNGTDALGLAVVSLTVVRRGLFGDGVDPFLVRVQWKDVKSASIFWRQAIEAGRYAFRIKDQWVAPWPFGRWMARPWIIGSFWKFRVKFIVACIQKSFVRTSAMWMRVATYQFCEANLWNRFPISSGKFDNLNVEKTSTFFPN